ncbi:cytochrome b/b6 domain-containing protein [Methylobacterium sp. WL9]|uniref:cytochrome b n=1 Tax=Methylobacterium sp. WL9 TaxID=2603898 RepID=UPI0011C7AF2C|nr:cytochrome b/b6 domain-containing protein [Methylobacterium sp. WL9]TXN22443.1 cytochrome b [Methylobacterium sp. WL9]
MDAVTRLDSTTGRYDRFTLGLHWTVASTTLLLWPLGQFTDSLPKGPIRANVWSLHFVLGFVFAGALVALFVWRQTGGRQLAVPETEPFHLLAKSVHVLLYVLAVCVAVLGIANAFVRGVSLFDLVRLPQLGDREWRHQLTDLHGLAAHCLAILALFHAAAALVHHYLWHDQVLRRMLPGRVSRG